MNILVIGGTRFFGIPMIEELLKSDPDVASTIQDITSNIHSRN